MTISPEMLAAILGGIGAMGTLIGWVVKTLLNQQFANQQTITNAYLEHVASSTQAIEKLAAAVEQGISTTNDHDRRMEAQHREFADRLSETLEKTKG